MIAYLLSEGVRLMNVASKDWVTEFQVKTLAPSSSTYWNLPTPVSKSSIQVALEVLAIITQIPPLLNKIFLSSSSYLLSKISYCFAAQ
jgi:hypothetical protein